MKNQHLKFLIPLLFSLPIAAGQTPATGPATTPATRPATRPAPGPLAPDELPGKGLAEHDFIYAGEASPLQIFIIRDGKVTWQYTHTGPKPGQGEISDASLLANGNILFAHQFGASIVSPDKKIVWSVDAPTGMEIHTAAAIDAEHVCYIENGNPPKLVIANITTSKTDKEFTLEVRNATQTHTQFRRVTVTPAGTFLVSHMDMGKVSEYDGAGTELKEIWTVQTTSPWSATRLKNGNTLITASSANAGIREVNPKGETVWQYTGRDARDAGYTLSSTQTAVRLTNGNTIINNWATPARNTTNYPIQAIEVTPEKKIVWALRSWKDPNLGASTNFIMLDKDSPATAPAK